MVAAVTLLGWTALGQYPQQSQFPLQPQYPQQQQDGDAPDPDAASHGTARISIMNGDVSVRRGDNGDFVAASVNAPLVVGDRVLTGPNSVSEVQFDWANMIRTASNTEIRLSELADHRYQIQLARGVATFRVLRDSQADVEVSTPQVSVRPKNQGVYRLAVRDDGTTEITVRVGEVDVFTPTGVESLRPGQTMLVRGTGDAPEFQMVAAYGEDEWDRWNTNRDRQLERAQSPQHVSRDIYGAEDLDNYGQWVPDPTYGTVWSPRQPAGWAPYRDGRWVWIDYYGWTWVSNDPWGWAPYHYGRWYMSAGYGWCWYPGAIGFGVRHYWSPALVAFVGFGRGGVGFGHVGWVPLAPYERYNRWYGRGFVGGRSSFNTVNVNVYNSYRNARVTNAVSAVDGAGFARGASGRAFSGDLRQASVVRGAVPVTPVRDSMRFSNRSVSPASVSRTSDNQRFFTRQSSPAVNRSFSQGARVSPVQPSGSSSQGGWRQFGHPTGSGPTVSPTPRAGSPATNSGWGRFGEPATRTAPAQSTRSTAPTGNSGWQRFEGRPSTAPAQQQQQQQASPRYSSPNQSRYTPAPNVDRSNTYRGGGNSPQSVRISPPMVRERSAPAPRSESRQSGGG